ncbi:MAG TPA: hypothetical protein VHV83_15420 [Armatimonadota bacterium]|nr:hypothetical protein [Armatimonadota bacterium]
MGWAELEIAKSKARKRCTPALASWTLSVVDRMLRNEYGPYYSMQCLQSSECIHSVLSEVGIRSVIVIGDLCAAAIHAGPPPIYGWSGFWGTIIISG